jgi:hypothetical protein
MEVSGCIGPYRLWGADEFSGEVVIEKSLSFMLLLMFPEQVRDCHCCSYCKSVFFVFSFLFCGCSVVLSFQFFQSSVSLREKSLPCSGFLNQENGVFSILIRYIYMCVCVIGVIRTSCTLQMRMQYFSSLRHFQIKAVVDSFQYPS